MAELAHRELWERYKKNNDLAAKEELILTFANLVTHHAKKLYRKSPFLFDYNDLEQSGTIGLIQAIEKFDINRDIKFETFANRRINGSMIDDINKLDWTPRIIRGNIRTYLQALERYHAQHQGEPTDEDLSRITADEDNGLKYLSPAEMKEARHQSRKTYLGSVDMENQYDTNANNAEEVINTPEIESPEEIFQSHLPSYDLLKVINETISNIDHLRILHLRYYEGKTLREIGKELGYNNTKTALLHREALKALEGPLTELIERAQP